MGKANFHTVTRELLSIQQDYKHDVDLYNRLDNVINQLNSNMYIVKNIIKNIK